MLAAGALRRDLAAARRRLTWHGATAGQRRLLTATESAAVGFGGAVLGWIVGAVVGAAAAALADAPALAVLRESVLSPYGLLLGLLVALGAGLVVFATVSLDLRRRGRIGALDVAAVLALLAALGILASGAVDGDELAAGGAAPVVLLALPGLIGFAAAVGAARDPAGRRRLARATRQPGRPARRRLARAVARRCGDRGGVSRARDRPLRCWPSRTGRRSPAASTTAPRSPCPPTWSCART